MASRLGCLLLLALLTACAMTAPTGGSPTPDVPSTRFATAPPLPTVPAGTPVGLSPDRLAAIKTALAARDVAVESLTVRSATAVTFNDGSLGCPQPGVSYTQAQVDGMRVLVDVAGRTYDFRFGRGDTPRLCERAANR